MVNNCVYSTARTIGVFGAVLLALAACSRKGDEPDVGADPIDTIFTAQELLDSAYNYGSYPVGFYAEDVGRFSTYYYNRKSIVGPYESHSVPYYELCTEARDQAFEWSELSAVHSSGYRALISERETEKYFEFKRAYNSEDIYPLLGRVHKRSYLEPSDSISVEGFNFCGIYQQRPITKSDVKELCEYYYARGRVIHINVFVSITIDHGDYFEHSIFSPRVIMGDYGLYDEITLFKHEYIVEKQSGLLKSRRIPKMTIKGRYNSPPEW